MLTGHLLNGIFIDMASAELKLLLGGKKKQGSHLQTGSTDDGRCVTEVRLRTFTVILCTGFFLFCFESADIEFHCVGVNATITL
jgi:hypothetical protein